jgi:hypothetical protein
VERLRTAKVELFEEAKKLRKRLGLPPAGPHTTSNANPQHVERPECGHPDRDKNASDHPVAPADLRQPSQPAKPSRKRGPTAEPPTRTESEILRLSDEGLNCKQIIARMRLGGKMSVRDVKRVIGKLRKRTAREAQKLSQEARQE